MPNYTFDNVPRNYVVSGQSVAVQWHHVINTDTYTNSDFLKAIGWQQNDIARNLIPLPANDASAQVLGGARHSGGHAGYNGFIGDIVGDFDAEYSRLQLAGLDTTQFLQNGAKQIDGLVSFLKVELTHPDSILILHSSDARIDLDSSPFWSRFADNFDTSTLSFNGLISESSAFKAGVEFTSAHFDATPGSGTPFDIDRGLGRDAKALALVGEFGLIDRPLYAGVWTHLGTLGKFGALLLGGLGLYNFSNEAQAAEQQAQQLLAEGDYIGAEAQQYGFLARQAFTTSRLLAAISASDGSFNSVMVRDAQLAAMIETTAERTVILNQLAGVAQRGGSIPLKYQSTYLDALASGEISLASGGATVVGGFDPVSVVNLPSGVSLNIFGDSGQNSLINNSLSYNTDPLGVAAQSLSINETDWSNSQLWSNRTVAFDLSDGVTTTDVQYRDGRQTAIIHDTTDSYNWDYNTTNRVGGAEVTSTSLDNGARVTTVQSDFGSYDMNGDGAVNAADSDILFGEGGADISGGTGDDIIMGGSAADQLGTDGSRTRYTVSGWDATVHDSAGYSFEDVANNFGKIDVFGADKATPIGDILTGANVGALFGSTIGNMIAGDNVFAQIGTSAVLSTALSAVGAQFDKMFGLGSGGMSAFNAITQKFETAEGLGATFAASVRTAGIGALTSFLTAELAEGLNVNTDSFGGALFTFATSQVVSKLASFAVANVGAGLEFTEGISGSLFGSVNDVLSSPIFTPGNIAAFAGSYLAKQIIDVENIGGAIGQAALGALGSLTGIGLAAAAAATMGPLALVAVPLLFAFGGTVAGTWLGNLIGNLVPDNTDCMYNLYMESGGTNTWVHDDVTDSASLAIFKDVRDKAHDAISELVEASGGRIVAGHSLNLRIYAKPANNAYEVRVMEYEYQTSFYQVISNSSNPNTMLDFGVTKMMKLLVDRGYIVGGDPRILSTIKQSTASTAQALGLQVTWAQIYNAAKSTLDGFAGPALTSFTRMNFNNAVGTSAEAAWRVGRLIASEMGPADNTAVGIYLKNALTYTAATDARLLLAQLYVAQMFGTVVEAAKSIGGGTWSGLVIPDFDVLDAVQNAGETNAAYSIRLQTNGVRAAVTSLNAATKSSATDTFVIKAIAQAAAANAATAGTTAISAQVLLNQLQVAGSVGITLKGLTTVSNTDDSEFVKSMLSTLSSAGVSLTALGTPNFASFVYAAVQPATVNGSVYEATLLAKAQSFIVDALQTATMTGDAIAIKAIRNTTAVTVDALLKQIYVARYTSSLLNDDESGVGYKTILKALGVTVSQYGAMNFNTIAVNATANAQLQSQVASEGVRFANLALAGATMSGDAALIAALRSDTTLVLKIIEKYEGYTQGLLGKFTSDGGSLVHRGVTAFSKIDFAKVKAKSGAALEAAIVSAAKILAFDAVKGATFTGLDLYTTRMLANTHATLFEELAGDYVIVSDYKAYAESKDIIDILVAADAEKKTAFASGWTATLLKATEELKLAQISAIDFTEGFASFVTRLDLRYWGIAPVELTPRLQGTSLIVLDDGTPATDNDLIVSDFVAVAGLASVASALSTGTAANELWQAAASGGTFADGASTVAMHSHDVLLGAGGIDHIAASDGNDYVAGGESDDLLGGGRGNDIIVGGAGDDAMSGGDGDDVYSVDSAGDTVNEVGSSGADTVYSSVNVVLSENVERLMLLGTAVVGSGNALANSIVGNASNNVVNSLDGDDIIYGLGGIDVLRGAAGNDLISGGAGNDTLYGDGGDDVYVFERNARDTKTSNEIVSEDNIDTVFDYAGSDALRLGPNILLKDLNFNVIGGNLEMTLGVTGSALAAVDKVIVANWASAEGNRLETIEFADGGWVGLTAVIHQLFEQSQLWNFTVGGSSPWVSGQQGNVAETGLTGKSTDDILRAFGGNDYLYATEGSDAVDGGDGVDTVSYHLMNGSVNANLTTGVVLKSNGTADALFNMENVYGSNYQDVLHGDAFNNVLMGRAGNDTVYGMAGSDSIYAGEGNDIINGGDGVDIVNYSTVAAGGRVVLDLLAGTATKTDGSADTLSGIENATGTSLNDFLYGSAGNNVLAGLDGGDWLWGRQGRDSLSGGGGNDYYLFVRGDARFVAGGSDNTDTIVETDGTGDVLWIRDADIIRSQISFALSGSDLLIKIDDPNSTTAYDQVKVADWIASEGNRLESIDFLADGSKIGVSTIIYSLYQTAGLWNYTIGGLNPWINGTVSGAVNDTITGTSADNIIRGFDGNDTINASTGNDTIDGGNGSDLASYQSLTGQVLVDLRIGSVIKTQYASTDALYNVENVYSGSGHDWLFGDTASNVLMGRAGNDTVYGMAGNDYIYAGEDSDAIDGGDDIDTVNYGYTAATKRVIVNLAAGTAERRVIATNAIDSSDTLANVENVVGSYQNDTMWGSNGNNVINGVSGIDTIQAYAGDDTLIGGTGNDTVAGSVGNDTYQFARGDGQDIVLNQDASTATMDIVRMSGAATGATAITSSGIWLARSGNDLVVSVLASADKMTFQGWYADTAARVDQIISTDGKILRTAGVQQLVNAMAAYSPSTAVGGTGIQPGAVPTAVQTAINSAWTTT